MSNINIPFYSLEHSISCHIQDGYVEQFNLSPFQQLFLYLKTTDPASTCSSLLRKQSQLFDF